MLTECRFVIWKAGLYQRQDLRGKHIGGCNEHHFLWLSCQAKYANSRGHQGTNWLLLPDSVGGICSAEIILGGTWAAHLCSRAAEGGLWEPVEHLGSQWKVFLIQDVEPREWIPNQDASARPVDGRSQAWARWRPSIAGEPVKCKSIHQQRRFSAGKPSICGWKKLSTKDVDSETRTSKKQRVSN